MDENAFAFPDMIGDLNRDVLKDIGVKAVGHQVKIMKAVDAYEKK